MKQMGTFILLILPLLCIAPPLHGESWKAKSLDYMDTVFWAADDPNAAHAWAARFLEKPASEVNPKDLVAAAHLAFGSAVQLELWDWIKQREPRLREIWQQAQTLNMRDQYLNIGQSLAEFLAATSRHTEAVQVYEQVIHDARLWNNDSMLVFNLTYLGQYYRSVGQMPAALQWMREAYNLASDPQRDIHPYFRQAALLTAAMTLQGEGLVKDGDALLEKAFAYFEEQNLRAVTAVLAFNMAATYSIGKNPQFAKASFYSHKARNLSRSLGDVTTEGAALTKLATISNKQKRYEEALAFGNSAIAVIRGKDSAWEAMALRENAEALTSLGQLNQASAAIDRAIEIQPKNYQESLADMYQVKSMIEERSGHYQLALLAFQTFQKIRADITEDREKETFAKAKTEMALEVEEQKNQLLKTEVELQATRLEATRHLQMGALALAVLLLLAIFSLAIAIRKSRQTTRARQQIQRILDLIEEGILTIGPDLKLQASYSRYLADLYPDLDQKAGLDAISILIPDDFMDNEGKSIVRETLKACLGHEMLAWELNSSHLPTEIVSGNPARSLSLHWQPILGADQCIRSFLLGIRDITKAKILEAAVAKEQKFVQDLERKLKELLATRYADAKALIDSMAKNSEIWQTEITREKVSAATRRVLHTNKGVARSLGLRDLSSAIHELESTIDDPEAFERLAAHIHQYQHLIKDVLGNQLAAKVQNPSLVDVLSAPIQQLRERLRTVAIDWQAIEISDGVEQWPEELLPTIQEILIHALNNSADHGYILPKKAGRDPGPAVFRVAAEESVEGIQLLVRDQGVGLNLQQLEALARKLKFTPSVGESFADVVFLDGASTSERATETSGRGLGMAAIRASCRQWGGDARIRNNPEGPGSQLILHFKKEPGSGKVLFISERSS